jgi:ribonucleoside-diphosphate reductase alpha chain
MSEHGSLSSAATEPAATQSLDIFSDSSKSVDAAKTPSTSKGASKGLTIKRHYTKPGADVWKTVEWELRSASIVNEKGDVIFKQDGVEIPSFWSQMATNIVASKYFRGQVDTLEREYSVKQLIGRVADTFLEWG